MSSTKPFKSPHDIVAFAKALFPESAICLQADVWDDGRSRLSLWVASINKNLIGQSYAELAAGIQRAHAAQSLTPSPDAVSAIASIAETSN